MARRFLCVMLAVMLLILAIPTAFAASGYKAYFNTSSKVYKSASTKSASMKVSKGTTCTIVAIKGDWARVKRGNVTAYCYVKNLTLSSRIKGYTCKSCKIYASASKSSKSASLGLNTTVYIVGRDGDYYRVQNESGSVTGYIPMSNVSGKKTAVKNNDDTGNDDNNSDDNNNSGSDWKSKVVALDWYNGGSSVVSRGSYAYIYDIESGLTIKVKRLGGSSHADLEPATSEDTAKLLKMCGGEYSWDSRAVILYKDGKYVACAMNTMPHGDQSIDDNNYDGQFCLHMVNSRTHGTDSINENHQKAIKKAYNWAHS